MPASWCHPQDIQSSRAAFQAKYPTGHQRSVTLAQATWSVQNKYITTHSIAYLDHDLLWASCLKWEHANVNTDMCFFAFWHMMRVGRLSFSNIQLLQEHWATERPPGLWCGSAATLANAENIWGLIRKTTVSFFF